jgi:hypothetical protein
MLAVGFENTIPESERVQKHALDHAATGISRFQLPIKNLHLR